ncbi:MAG: NADH:ubiquinone reductase (Na(+)-transporting) subunit C [Bacteroidales bacterium]|nr:NADH:ubiquinone reductase (Na(+)-transporting) subunit C [Bacteroidales bacterium]
MNTNSNLYTIVYSTILVVVVAGVLAFVSMALKPKQQENIALEKMQNILNAAALGEDAAQLKSNKAAYIKGLYAEHITNSYILNIEGKVIDGEAFDVDLKAQYNIMKAIGNAKDDATAQALKSKLQLPVFVCTIDSMDLNIFPCYGAGLWGPIWGYLSVEDDFATLHGAIFDHKSETPGLGAEIAKPKFYSQFAGKKLEKEGKFHSIDIVKGGGQVENPNGVDAVSGATITSRSLQETMAAWFAEYMPYINLKREAVEAENSPCCCGSDTTGVCTNSCQAETSHATSSPIK